MMEEPKNLKDIFENDEKDSSGFITAQILRTEAIKHIKNLRRGGRDFYQANIDEKSVIPWIKDFFGISEEDLK